ncbi:MAG: biotin--[acetyl-CoA-carboxylase] ligase [Actinomycetota bacterium]|nr:biotin--[acetyl-CoA-carboxylase] ligase [Actinomycetota bacterium]
MSEVGWIPDPGRVRELLAAAGCPWPAPSYVESTGSTNADALALASSGAADGTCVVAGEQTAGKGRHGRTWVSDRGAGLWSSTIVRSCDRPARLPLLAALAAVDVARDEGDMSWAIKWPNDVLDFRDRKVAGILVEGFAGGAVVGIGINVERPPLDFTQAGSWVGVSGVSPDRSAVLAGLLSSFYRRTQQPWDEALVDYRVLCRSIGADVRVVLPGGEEFDAVGVDVTADGHLMVDTGSTSRIIIAGDVLHAIMSP